MGEKDDVRDRIEDLGDSGTWPPLSELPAETLYMIHLRYFHDESRHPDAAEAWDEYERRIGGADPEGSKP